MEQQEILDKMHGLHLILADEVKRICEKYDIHYFMIAGTLLGAIRHKGFIPWDDDMDFGMKRCDYEKFLVVSEKELDHSVFTLQTDRNDRYYAFNFAKLRLNGTKVLESFSSKVSTNQGIYIDIFPLDYVYPSPVKRFFQFKSFWLFRNLLWVKCGYGDNERKKQFSYKLAHFLSLFFSINALKKLKYHAITGCNESEYLVTSDGTYGLQRETIKSKWISETADYTFEDRVYQGIKDYDAYLSYFYGDYLTPPPETNRNHHGRMEVDFGRYK